MHIRHCTVLILIIFIAGCHPYSCWHPKDFSLDTPLEWTSSSRDYPSQNTESYIDKNGIAHVFSDNELDLVYAQGFLHAKDRLWQIILQRAAIFGRLSEYFGKDLLEMDRRSRLMVYKIEEQYEALNDHSKKILEAYTEGVNQGAKYAGNSLEMSLLGVDFERYEGIHALGISRFLSWNLSTGMYDELARNRILARLDNQNPVLVDLLSQVDDLDNPVVAKNDNLGTFNEIPELRRQELSARSDEIKLDLRSIKAPPKKVSKNAPGKSAKIFSDLPKHIPENFRNFLKDFLEPNGASNVWAVSGQHTLSGHAVLAHDPHLGHSFPGLFYLVHLEHPDYTIAGASVPGLPGILLGHGRHVSWGTPVSNVDTQDLIRISPYENRDDLYLFDGQSKEYTYITQTYKLGKEEDAEVFEEKWKVTEFGPVLSDAYAGMMEKDDVFSLMWPAHETLNSHHNIVRFSLDLAKSKNIEEATNVIEELFAPVISVCLAFDNGDIAYRLSGEIPKRLSNESIQFPRDGSSSQAGWSGTFTPAEKPQLLNPTSGFIVAANQSILDKDDPLNKRIGFDGTLANRATRIKELLEEKTKNGTKLNAQQIYSIQQDIESIESRRFAKLFADHCPEDLGDVDDNIKENFCKELTKFNHQFTLKSVGALIYKRIERELRKQILLLHFNEEVVDQIQNRSFVRSNIYAAYENFKSAGEPALFDNREKDGYEGLAPLIKKSAQIVASQLQEERGCNLDNWQWGKVHTLTLKSAMSNLPWVGFLFDTGDSQETGCQECVRAEHGNEGSKDKVTYGAVLRVHSQMSVPIDSKLITEAGQSGHLGHKHSYDFNPLWKTGVTLKIATPQNVLEKEAEGKAIFLPKK